MKRLVILTVLAAGCGSFGDTLKDPQTVQYLDQVAQAGAEKAALKIAGQFQITDQSAIKQLTEQAKMAAAGAVNVAVNRLDAQDKAQRAQWREDTKAQIAASLQGVGGALASTGNPLLIGLGSLVGVAGLLFAAKKQTAKKEATTPTEKVPNA